MTKASDNAFPSILVAEGTEPSAPSAGQQRLYIDSTTHLLKATNSSGTDRTIEGIAAGAITSSGLTMATARLLGRTTASSGAVEEITVGSGLTLSAGSLSASSSGGMLGLNVYHPGTRALYSTTSATFADVDATNMLVTFTAPASTNVLVRLTAWIDVGTANWCYFGLRESTSNIGTPAATMVLRGANLQGWVSVPIYVSGISGGSHTYKWSFATDGTGTAFRIWAGNGNSSGQEAGAATMEVWAAP